MGKNKVKRIKFREWRTKNEARIWIRKKRNNSIVESFGIKKIKDREARKRNRGWSKL